MLNRLVVIFFFVVISLSYAQQQRIEIVHADNSNIDEENYPGATILLGNVYVEHNGVSMRSKKAIYYKKDNFVRAFGDVVMNQGDTISQTSKYVEYNGNNQMAVSWGDVILKDPLITLTTDTLYFDRSRQLLFYKSGATIKDTTNTLESNKGNYFLNENKFQALSEVVLTNPDYILRSDHLDYYTDNGQAFLYGPSTITGKENLIYTEHGFYDTKNEISYFTKDSFIKHNDRVLTADSLYYNRNTGFASATGNIQMQDTVNKITVRGGYGEFFQQLDSAYIVKRAVAVSEIEKDSMYIHGDTLLLTGKPEKRILRAYHHVKFFKSNLSGKCDSIYSNQETGLTKLLKNPVLWSEDSQITGDTIHLISNTETEKLDSLKVLQNAFVIQKDSAGFNQIKGRDILGKFIDNELRDINVIGNAETIFYVRDETTHELIGIDKMRCSKINFQLADNAIRETTCFTKADGETYPPSQFPDNVRKFKGFIWREKERPMTIEDIFIHDDTVIEQPDETQVDKGKEALMKERFEQILKEEELKKKQEKPETGKNEK